MRITLGKLNSEILFSKEDFGPLSEYLIKNQANYSSCFLLADMHLFDLYGDRIVKILAGSGLSVDVHTLPGGEGTKNLATAEGCWEALLAAGVDRRGLLVTLGGGTLTDLGGFISACYLRGIDCVHIPTSLLAMVDAAIGGKNGVNISGGRNSIGTIKQARAIIVTPYFLNSLSDRQLRSGLAEVIKAAIIWDPELFEYLQRFSKEILAKHAEKLRMLLSKAIKIKAEIVKTDEKEKQLRRILNYGHTFGHALEVLTNYQQFTHGEAVSIGMQCATKVSRDLNLCDDEFYQAQKKLCQSYAIPTQLPTSIDLDALIKLLYRDKKSENGKIQLILPRKIGKVDIFSDVDPLLIRKALSTP